MAEYETSSPDEEDTSEDFEERLSALKAKWKAALKRNKKLLLKCPNYDRCGFKCGSVGGMNYHFIRCAGKSPEFKCIQCNRSYESRTGLNYHNASFHSNESTPEDIKSESTARPQRSAALTTMSAIHIANNLPPLKQTYQKPPSASPHKTTPQGSTHHNTTPPKKAATPTNARSGKGTSSPGAVTKGGGVHGSKSTNVTATSQKSSLPSPTLKTTPPKQKMSPTVAPVSREQVPFFEVKLQQPAIILPKKVATPPPPLPELIEEPLIIHPSPKKSPLLSPSLKPACKQPKADGSGEIKKKGGRYITIPSIEYPNALLQDKYKFYLPLWRQEMKDNATIKCPNFSECEFKCTTVNGMKYHFVRCMKSNPPEFNCELCEKRFQCRTGLVWHLKKTHKMIDIHPTKSGGYKGSLPIELKFDSDLEDEDDDQLMEGFQLPPKTVSPVSPVKKKIKLDKPWGRQRPSTGYGADGSHEEDSALESSAQSGSEGDDELEMDFDDTPSSRRRLRKCLFPQRTADAILQNTAFSRVPPKPRLGPPTSKFHVPATEFSISNEIATDVDPKPSFDLFLGVEALEWQKMYSDSESESDYNPEYDDTGRVINYQSNSSVSDSDEEFMCSLTTRKKTTGGQRGPKPRGGGGGAGGPGRPRRGRGARSNVETNSGNSSRDIPMLVKPPEDIGYGAGGSLLDPGIHPPPILIKHQPQDLNNTIAATAATTTNATTAVGEEVRSSAELRVAHLPSVPALVKAPERMGSESNEIEEFDRLTSIGLPPPQQQQQHPPHHIQPPPSLVMPSPSSSISTPSIVPISSSSLSSLPSVGSHQRRREPPPLVRNTDKMTTPNSAIELQDSTSHGSRPQIICLSPGEQQQQQLQHQRRTPQQAGIPQQGSLSYSIVTQAPQPSYSIVTQQQQTSRNSQVSAVSVDGGGRGRGRGRGGGGGGGGGGQQPAPHKPRRPGRPRKDQSVTLSTGLRTSAKTVRLGGGGGGAEGGGGSGGGGGRGGRGGSSTRAHYRSGRGGGRAGQNSSQSTKKGMKMTQYEFENVSSSAFPPSLVSGGIPQALQQQQQQQQVQQQQAVAAQQQQPQLFQLGSGAAGVAQSLQSLVTPLQIIPTASIPGYHSVSGGGMLLLQNAPQGVTLAASPSGNDVVAPTNFLGGNTYQLVQAAPMITTDQGENAQKVSVIMHPTAGPVQYIAQFDGPPPKGKSSTKTPQSRKKLHEKFNKERKKEQAKLEQNTTAVMSTKLTKSKSKRSKTTDSDSTVVASGSASISAEKLMSSELEKYLKVEESRKKRKSSTSTTAATDAAAASSSDSGTGRKTKASTATIKRRKKQPDPVTSCPPKNVQETPGTEEEEVARVPEREEESGEPSGTKKTRTKAKKKSLLGKRKSRAKEETQEEDDDGEQQLPPNNEEGGPPTSSSPTKRDKTKSRDQEEKVEERERTIPADSEAASEVAMETESPQRSYTAARRGGRGRGRSKRMKIDSSNQETEHERTTPASSKEATMETQTSTAVATSSKRGSRRGRGRGSGTVPATDGKMHIPQLTSESTWEECTKVWRSSLKRKKGAHCPKCGSYKGNSISAMKYHWQRCGKTQEELTVSCPECDKTFQSEAGLSYHTRFHHSQPQEASTSNATPTVDIFAEVDITKPIPERRAAKQAAERLNQLTRSIGVQAVTTTTTTAPTSSSPGDVHVDEVKGDVGGAGAGVYVGSRGGGGGENFEEEFGFSQEEMLSFKAKIEREKSVNCPVEDCERVFKSYKGLQYHLKRHRVPKDSLPCPHCKKVLAGRKRFENHIRLRHPDMDVELVSMDYEYRPSVHADSDEEDPEELDAEKSAEKSAEKDVGKGRGGTKRKQRRTRAGSLLIAGAPVTLHQYQKTLKEKLEHLYGHREGEGVGLAEQGEGPLTSASWQPMTEDWSRVPNSELTFYLPTSKQSMTYALEIEGKGKGETAEAVTADCTLPLFGTTESSDGTTMFFTGGPVWAMDWLCTRDGQDTPSTDAAGERHLVLAAYRDYDETFPIDAHLSHKGLLQVWSAGDLTHCEQGLPPSSSSSSPSSSPRSLPRLKLGIAHNFGCIRSIKSCPHDNGLMVGVASKGDTPLRQHHLGVLALACSDGCARILNIPDPAHLQSVLPSPKKTAAKSNAKQVNVDPTALFVKPRRVSAILVPSGLGVQDWSSFGQCLCIDWFPGNQHTRIAAGYYNGCVCVWDLGSSLLNGGCGAAAALGARQQLHPLIQIMGQSEPCRALAWCPHDSNYLVTGGYTKCLTLWDIRQPFSPVDRQDKGFTSYEIVWPLLWCHTLLRYDTSGSAGPSHSHGIVHSSYVVKPQQATNRMVTSNLGPLCSMSYSDWTDRVVASSFAGDVSVTSFDGNYHLTSLTDHKNFLPNTNRHKIVCYCYTKPLEQSSSEPGDEPQVSDSLAPAVAAVSSQSSPSTMKEKARTHRLIFSHCHHLSPQSRAGSFQPDSVPLAAFTKVCWSPDQGTSEWLLLATTSGLVQLLRLPRKLN